jgi:hypothetical protein
LRTQVGHLARGREMPWVDIEPTQSDSFAGIRT